MITNFEKFIYNEHLKISRSSRNKPFKFRENFNDFDPKSEILVKKLSAFFNKFKHIKPSDFFHAPFEIYKEDDYFDLSFFCSQRAIKTYSLYIKNEMLAEPDSPQMLIRIVDGLKFIKEFLQENQLTLSDYSDQIDGSINSFLVHFKENRFPIYILYGIPDFENIFKKINTNILYFMFGGSIIQTIDLYRSKFLGSQKAKLLVRSGLSKINQTQTTHN